LHPIINTLVDNRVGSDGDGAYLAELIAKDEISKCLAEYCTGVDRKDFDLFRSAYHPDAYDDHGIYKGDVPGLIAAIESRHQTIRQSMHFLGTSRIELDGTKANAETYCLVMQRTDGGPDGDKRISIGCRYLDLLEDRGDGWRIAERTVAYEWWGEEPCEDEPPMGPEMTQSVRSKEDALYRIGSMVLASSSSASATL